MKEITEYTDTDIGYYESIKKGETTVALSTVLSYSIYEPLFHFNKERYNKLKSNLEEGCGYVIYKNLLSGDYSFYSA